MGSRVLNPMGLTKEGVVSSGAVQERGVFLSFNKAPACNTPNPPGSEGEGLRGGGGGVRVRSGNGRGEGDGGEEGVGGEKVGR